LFLFLVLFPSEMVQGRRRATGLSVATFSRSQDRP
jgi:hypothetical protein